MTTSPILLAYDGSPDAERALDWAATEARETGTPLLVMMVEDVSAILLAGTAVGVVSSAASTALDHARTVLAEIGVEAVTVEHRVGRVANELLGAAESASVVVLGSRGHGPAGEALLGSVSQHVARHASCPVVVVRQPRTARARRIVVGVDGSPGSCAALAYACERAERTRDVVVALHAWHVRAPSTDVWSSVPRTLKDEEERRLVLAESVAGVQQDHPDVTLEMEVVAVDPAASLADASAGASLVVVGSRGLGFVGGLLLGSVSREVLHRAQCPVAVVR